MKINSLKLILLILFTFCSSNLFANKKITLQLSWLHQFQFAGYYMAKELGYYKQKGIDLKINEYEYGLDLSKVLSQNKADFAMGRSSLLIDRLNNEDIVALTSIYQQSPLILLVKEDSGIKKIEDLKNKNIMITLDAKSSAPIIAMLNSKGITLNDVKIQNHSFNLDDLINNKTDAMASYISNEPIRLDQENIKYKIFNPKDYGFQFYDDILYTSSQFIKSNPTLTKDFLEATLKGWEYAFKNKVKTAELIHKKYNTQNKTLIQLIKEAEVLKNFAYDKGDDKIGCLDKDVLQNIVNTYKILGLMNKDIDLDNFVYEHNPHKLYKFNFNTTDIIVISISIVLFIVAIILIFLYTSIKSKLLHTNTQLKIEIEKSKKNQEILLQHSKITAISKLLQNISHQWRQPLSVVSLSLSNIKLLLEMDSKFDKNEMTKMADISLKNIEYISKVIDEFATYLDSDKVHNEATTTKVIVNKLINILDSDFKKKAGHFIEDVEDIKVNYDQNLLIQSLINIYNNAIDAFENKNIDKEERYIFFYLYKLDDKIVIKIKDSALGIQKEILKVIFEPYTTTKHQSIGVGLDMYITYHIIVDLFGGDISARNVSYVYDNKKLSGAEFEIILPIVEE